MTKYTTEAKQELSNKIAEMIFNWKRKVEAMPAGKTVSCWVTEEILDLFTDQKAALIEEIEKRLPEKASEVSDSHELGYDTAIREVLETLEAIRKELK